MQIEPALPMAQQYHLASFTLHGPGLDHWLAILYPLAQSLPTAKDASAD
jgi:hypothetical protein